MDGTFQRRPRIAQFVCKAAIATVNQPMAAAAQMASTNIVLGARSNLAFPDTGSSWPLSAGRKKLAGHTGPRAIGGNWRRVGERFQTRRLRPRLRPALSAAPSEP